MKTQNIIYKCKAHSFHCSGLFASLRVRNLCCARRTQAKRRRLQKSVEKKYCGVIYAFAPDAAGTILYSHLHGVTTSVCNDEKNSIERKSSSTCGTTTRFQTRLSQHQQTDTVSALSLDKSRAKKVHVSNVIYAFDWRRSGLTLAHTRFKCNFAVDFTMCLPNFWTSWCAATASFGKIGFSHHTPLQSESIRRTNASDSFCPWSRERWQRLRSIDETFGHLVDARVLFSPFVDV